jgi:hypothetical protein
MNLNPNDGIANYLWTQYTKDMKKLQNFLGMFMSFANVTKSVGKIQKSITCWLSMILI